MPRALALPVREQIVSLHQQGLPLTEVAQHLGLSYRTVCALWRCFRVEGPAGLQTRYDRCGTRGVQFPDALEQAALALKREHPRWGAGLIRLQLALVFPGQALPGRRSLQRWFQTSGLQPARSKHPVMERPRGQAVHEVWELDAKERLRLLDGSGACVLNVSDEASGAALGAAVFPPVPLEPGSGLGGATGVAEPV